MRVLLVCLLVLLLVPGWSGEEPRQRLGPRPQMIATRVSLDPTDPHRKQVGGLTFVGGVALSSLDPAFGGFSSLSVVGDRFTLLGDGGGAVGFRMGADWKPFGLWFADLPGGPGTGWEKRDRDTESMTRDPRRGTVWIGFENANAFWRYDPTLRRVERWAAPHAMREWEDNGGPESLVRLADGRFVTIAEDRITGQPRGRRMGLMFLTDPTEAPWPSFSFTYMPARGFAVSDMTQLPYGRLLVLERRFSLPYRFTNRLVLVELSALRPGATISGKPLATLAPPLIHDNFEGIAAQREGGATIIWLVSDDNQSILQRSLLLKFKLTGDPKISQSPVPYTSSITDSSSSTEQLAKLVKLSATP